MGAGFFEVDTQLAKALHNRSPRRTSPQSSVGLVDGCRVLIGRKLPSARLARLLGCRTGRGAEPLRARVPPPVAIQVYAGVYARHDVFRVDLDAARQVA